MLGGARGLADAHLLTTLRRSFMFKTSTPCRLMHSTFYREGDASADVYSDNRALQDHVKSGSLSSAVQLFDGMLVRDVVSWNLLISGHKRHGLPDQALELYAEMVSRGVRETPSTFSTALSVCSSSGFYLEGLQLHGRVILLGFERNLHIGSSVVDLYMRMGFLDVGMRVFDEMSERTCAAWNLVLRGYCELHLWDEMFQVFQRMKSDGIEPNDVSWSYLMKWCCNEGLVNEGRQLHCHFVKVGLSESNLFASNRLVDLYAALGSLPDLEKAIKIIPEGDVISWNSVIYAYADSGDLSAAMEYFSMMLLSGKRPAVRSFVRLLNLFGATENVLLGRQFHSFALKQGLESGDVYVLSALIDMYGKCYDIRSSTILFESSGEITVVCCNALITSFLHCDAIQDAISLFGVMTDEGIGFDDVSLSSTLKALSLSSSTNLTCCSMLHCCAVKSGFASDNAVSCALIDAYAKLGQVLLSRKVFEILSSPNVVCFTSIINAYAGYGMGRVCLELLELMIKKGLKPDRVTLLCVLTGCNHSGLLKEGKLVFDSMKAFYGVDPDRLHYSCMIDLLGRAGLLTEAEDLLEQPLVRNDPLMWSSLLRSCRVHQSEELGRRAASHLIELAQGDPASCSQASSFYYEIGDFESFKYFKELATAGKVYREIGTRLLN